MKLLIELYHLRPGFLIDTPSNHKDDDDDDADDDDDYDDNKISFFRGQMQPHAQVVFRLVPDKRN